jgi:hypothetical protein
LSYAGFGESRRANSSSSEAPSAEMGAIPASGRGGNGTDAARSFKPLRAFPRKVVVTNVQTAIYSYSCRTLARQSSKPVRTCSRESPPNFSRKADVSTSAATASPTTLAAGTEVMSDRW